MGRREINAEIFQDTIAFLKESKELQAAVTSTGKRQRLITANDNIPESKLIYERNAGIIVSGKRTLEAASAYNLKSL